MIAALGVALALSGVVDERLAQAETPGCVAVALVAEKTETAFGCTALAGYGLTETSSPRASPG